MAADKLAISINLKDSSIFMLQILRKKAQSTFIQIIVVVIALVFIFWGVGSNLGRDRQSALVVNGEEVSFQEYQQAYDRTYERFSQQFGGNMPKDLAESLGIKQQVINQLVQTSLLRQGAKKMGIYVSAEEVRKVIENMVQFQDNGAFSMDRYKAVLTNIRTAPTKFEKSMRTDRLAELAVREIGNFASVATDSEIQEIYSQLNEKVEVNFVSFKPADFLNQVQISDEALSAWYETVKDNYKTAPEIQLKYFTYTYDKIAAKVEIDDAQIENYYRENTQLFAVPEQRKASHILFKTNANDSEQVLKEKEAKALEVLALAKNGSNFAELAKEYSEGPSRENGGELGYFSQGQMVPTFDDAVFSMEKGAISEVVKTQFGYHIIYLEDIKPSSIRSLEEAKSQIVATLKEKEAESLAFQVANSVYEGIIAAGGLDQYLAATPDAEHGHLEDAMQVIRQHHPGVYLKRVSLSNIAHTFSQPIDMADQQVVIALGQIDGEKVKPPGMTGPKIIGHVLSSMSSASVDHILELRLLKRFYNAQALYRSNRATGPTGMSLLTTAGPGGMNLGAMRCACRTLR